MGIPGTQEAPNGISVLQGAPSQHFACEESHSYKGDISEVPLQRKPRLGDPLFTHAGPATDARPLSLLLLLVYLVN